VTALLEHARRERGPRVRLGSGEDRARHPPVCSQHAARLSKRGGHVGHQHVAPAAKDTADGPIRQVEALRIEDATLDVVGGRAPLLGNSQPRPSRRRSRSRSPVGSAQRALPLRTLHFLYKLTFPSASVVPAGTPLRVARTEPIPSTGPYRVARFEPDHELQLVRNPHFEVWSADARPDGYADEIHLRLSEDVAAQVAAVERRRADVMLGPPGGG
jgi:Bacterial extracellular solute-binding proteins, family 5 Middle